LNNQFDFYFSLSDVSAAQNIGSVLAQRCLEAGITNVFLDDQSDEQMTEKV
jgi:ribosomal protein L18